MIEPAKNMDSADLPKAPLASYDRLFFYLDNQLDVECESVAIEYVDGQNTPLQMKVHVARRISPVDEMVHAVCALWLQGSNAKITVQFGISGKMIKTEGRIANLKISSESLDPAKMTYSVVCNATAFQ